MNRSLATAIWALCLALFSGCSSDPNEAANELYVEASQAMEATKAESESYLRAFELYNSAREALDRISSKYAASNVAVGLLSGQTKISGFTLEELRNLGPTLELLAKAERDPLSCALLIAKAIADKAELAKAKAGLAWKGVRNLYAPTPKTAAVRGTVYLTLFSRRHHSVREG